MAVELTDRCGQDRPEVERFLEKHNTRIVARDGVLVDALEHPAVLARAGGELCGVATYVVEHDDCELLTLHTTIRHIGIGTALLDAVRGHAVQQGCGLIRVVARGESVLAPSVTRRLLTSFASPPCMGEDDATRLGRLTEREREVLRLIAQGLSNAEIGEVIFLSEATVKTHVGRVLTKLECRDRVQAAIFALQTGFAPLT